MKRILVLVALTATALVLSSAASANALKCAHGSSCNPAAFEPPTTSTSGPGTLPFTGLDLAGIAEVSQHKQLDLILVASGLARRGNEILDVSA